MSGSATIRYDLYKFLEKTGIKVDEKLHNRIKDFLINHTEQIIIDQALEIEKLKKRLKIEPPKIQPEIPKGSGSFTIPKNVHQLYK